jgi:TPR repeat protein
MLWLFAAIPFTATGEDRASREAVEALEAYAVYKMGRYGEAYARFLALARKNNIQGMLNAANMLQAGLGTGRDEAAALALYRGAAGKGSATGMFYTGLAYLHGRGADRDPAQARRWLRMAGDAGSSEAQLELGKLLLRDGDEEAGLDWIGRARFAAAWRLIDRAAANRNAPGVVHYLARDAEIRLRLPGLQNWMHLDRRGLRDFWQQTFDRALRYGMQREISEYRPRDGAIAVDSVIDETIGLDGHDERLRLRESALVRIANDRVVIERLSIVIERI